MAWVQCPVCKGTGITHADPKNPSSANALTCTVCEGDGYLQNWKDTDKVNKKDEKK